ncbi:MAG: 23S rRNA (adenine(2503)-C(2))-methyltransferase RlmN [Anaerolineales bacterium]|jgi:23S rRNA (adenine2503-C2)-methyltransferase
MINSPFIYDLEQTELEEMFAELGEPSYRANQVWQGLYKQYWNTPDEFTTLSKSLRGQLDKILRFEPLRPIKYLDSSDGQTRKTLFQLHDKRLIEAVLMKYDPSTHKGQGRHTLCISSQAGCAMGCVFCATGQMGFMRNLTSGEIVAQVMYYARMLHEKDENVTNIVLMGMGEPFHNYDEVMAAIDRLNDPDGYNFGARRFTISTVGLIPKIRQFADEKRQVNLAISLHAAEDEERSAILPINKKYNISKLLEACRYYVDQTSRRITFEWALIAGVNDTEEVARKLASRLKGLMCHVNAIPLNPTEGYQGQATNRQSAAKFKETLEQAGIPCTIRQRRGIDIQAGCGQLAVSAS